MQPGSVELTDRMMRVIRTNQRSQTPSGRSILLGSALIGAVAFGAWWTTSAVLAGDAGALVIRFGISVLLGLYYWALCVFVPK